MQPSNQQGPGSRPLFVQSLATRRLIRTVSGRSLNRVKHCPNQERRAARGQRALNRLAAARASVAQLAALFLQGSNSHRRQPGWNDIDEAAGWGR